MNRFWSCWLACGLTLACHAAQYGFDEDDSGKPPRGFTPALSGTGEAAGWIVRGERTAPSPPAVLTQTNVDATSYRFPLCVLDAPPVLNPELSVRFRAVAGKKDQAAGLVWRFQDTNSFYVVRANAVENNVVLYKMAAGKRIDLKPKGMDASAYGRKVAVAPMMWHTLKVKVTGSTFKVFLNGEELFIVEDSSIQNPGRVGVWTKADSLVEFDDFSVEETRGR